MQQNTVYRPFVPLMMLAAALVIWLGFSTMQLMQDRDDLRLAGEKQQTLVDQSSKLRAQLSAIGNSLIDLREQGNPNATEIMNQLEKSGFKMPSTVPASASASASSEDEQDTPPQ